jgi:hypothetical protein
MAELFAMHLVHKHRKMSGQAQEVTDIQEISVVLNLKISSTDNTKYHLQTISDHIPQCIYI